MNWPFGSKIPMFAWFAVIAWLFTRISECAFLPGFWRLMILKLSNGMLSALPNWRRLDLGGEHDVAGDVSGDVCVCVCVDVKYDNGIYLLWVASNNVGSYHDVPGAYVVFCCV